jgi:hypothetical protein
LPRQDYIPIWEYVNARRIAELEPAAKGLYRALG